MWNPLSSNEWLSEGKLVGLITSEVGVHGGVASSRKDEVGFIGERMAKPPFHLHPKHHFLLNARPVAQFSSKSKFFLPDFLVLRSSQRRWK